MLKLWKTANVHVQSLARVLVSVQTERVFAVKNARGRSVERKKSQGLEMCFFLKLNFFNLIAGFLEHRIMCEMLQKTLAQ